MASTRSRAIDFAIERQRHAGFVGRAELLTRLDQLVIADRTDRWVVVTGGPGMGKSAVLATWLARREVAGDVVPHHFIRRGWANWDDPETLVSSLVAQIEARFLEPREPEADEELAPAARLVAVLLRVSERVLVPRGERLVLLIDGLDEYDARPGSPPGDPLAAFLPYALPLGVSVLCASRPRHPYLDKLAMRGALVKNRSRRHRELCRRQHRNGARVLGPVGIRARPRRRVHRSGREARRRQPAACGDAAATAGRSAARAAPPDPRLLDRSA